MPIKATTPAANRLRVKVGYCNEYYDHQEDICRGWKLGAGVPKGLAIGELPELAIDIDFGDVVDWNWRAE